MPQSQLDGAAAERKLAAVAARSVYAAARVGCLGSFSVPSGSGRFDFEVGYGEEGEGQEGD